jgi:hypothetical protein
MAQMNQMMNQMMPMMSQMMAGMGGATASSADGVVVGGGGVGGGSLMDMMGGGRVGLGVAEVDLSNASIMSVLLSTVLGEIGELTPFFLSRSIAPDSRSRPDALVALSPGPMSTLS